MTHFWYNIAINGLNGFFIISGSKVIHNLISIKQMHGDVLIVDLKENYQPIPFQFGSWYT